MGTASFNPIQSARRIETSYREYIATTIHFADEDLQSQLKSILNRPGFLAKGPFLESAPPYKKGKSVAQLIEEGVLCRSMLELGNGNPHNFDADRPLYTHQVNAVKKAVAGRNYAVVTGTGSGKTECFLLPILNDILSEFEERGASPGVRAMILYPMNALANDQLKRLRELLIGTPVTFGRYTGDTEKTQKKAVVKWREENPDQQLLPNEIISRDEIRENPPNILLTNYSMLEYLLLRPEDAPLFGSVFGANWRHLAIDEAHVYTGALGTEIAYLIRRLKARIAAETGSAPKLHCYATSATIGSKDDLPKVARFARDLFGEHFEDSGGEIDVVTSDIDSAQNALDAEPWGSLPLSAWSDLRNELQREGGPDADNVEALLWKSNVPAEVVTRMDGASVPLGLGRVLLGETSCAKLVRRCSRLLDLTDISNIAEIGIDGLVGDAKGIETLTAMVEVLSAAERSKGVPILSSRYHSFLRAPEGLFLNLRNRRLTPHKMVEELDGLGNSTPVYEVSVCRHCGQAYILGNAEAAKEVAAYWLNPRHEGTDADDEFIPRVYYRVLNNEAERDPDEDIDWLCPTCGTLHDKPEEGKHRFEHEAIARIPVARNQSTGKAADEFEARCRHCGYQSRVAIQPMRVSPEAAGSVVCYDLVRDVPPFEEESDPASGGLFAKAKAKSGSEVRAGSIICFSDKRQDAAFFAPAMERTYSSITRRQIIYEAVKTRGADGGCTPSAAIHWMASILEKRYPKMLHLYDYDSGDLACAWMLDELAAEDSRNSLDGLGVIRVEPTAFNEGFDDPDVLDVVDDTVRSLHDLGFTWMSRDDYVTFAKVCLDTLRERGAVAVPAGVETARSNFTKRGNFVIQGGPGSTAEKDAISFVCSPHTTENKRSAFVRKYARKVHDKDLSRDDATVILQSLYDFIVEYIGFIGENHIVGEGGDAREKFRLGRDLWRLFPYEANDVVYRCDTCGCATHLDTGGVCMTAKCEGEARATTFAELEGIDSFYKELYREEALPIRIEEHTAQLSSKRARQVQSDFIKGRVNVLSCTTTFELGVDVGDLRTIFMRNVPPSTANYTQRAGRVGRRAGMPGYAVTFARLRPHDIAHYQNPERIIAGSTHVPACYLENDAIALRHVFAVALSEFFRADHRRKDVDYAACYNDFMKLADERPDGLDEIREFLESRPQRVIGQLEMLVPGNLHVAEDLGIDDWGWVDKLVGEPDDDLGIDSGRLLRTHGLKHADYARIQEGIEENEGSSSSKAAALMRSRGMLESERTIAVLAENGILPKYGFPTDLVELNLPQLDQSIEDNRLTLQRGMRQAIREYAPGSEVVAGKTLWRSVGIRKPRGHVLAKRRYGTCPECDTFVWPIDNYSSTGECPVCKTEFSLDNIMLIPSYGFSGREMKKGIGLRRPRTQGFVSVQFSQHSIREAEVEEVKFSGGSVQKRYAGNGQLCALNAPRGGFMVCDYCGSAATAGEEIKHWNWCGKDGNVPHVTRYNALGSAFVSDVLELSFRFDSGARFSFEEWESVAWALYAAASQVLEIPETEMGVTWYENEMHGMSVMLYDDVPGGAGHAQQLSERVDELMRTAYEVVDGHCGCGGETCCYGCIANYYNQAKQAVLSRDSAKRVLAALLQTSEGALQDATQGEAATCEGTATSNALGTEQPSAPVSTIEPSFDNCLQMEDEDFQDACEQSALYLSGEAADFINAVGAIGAQHELESPTLPVVFSNDAGASAEASLVWKDAKVVFLDRDALDEFVAEFGPGFKEAMHGYLVVTSDDGIDPQAFVKLLKERSTWR